MGVNYLYGYLQLKFVRSIIAPLTHIYFIKAHTTYQQLVHIYPGD